MSNSLFTRFFTVPKKQIGKWYDIISKKLLSQIMALLCFIFKDHLFIEGEDNPSDKVVTVVEEPHGVDIDCIGNVLDLPRFMFINKEYGNLKVVVADVGFTREKITVGSSQKFYKLSEFYKYFNSVTNAKNKIEVAMIFLVVMFFVG